MTKAGVILFGGSFDPIHVGHLSMAQFAIDYLSAERLVFIPAARSPHKNNAPSASGSHRLEMIRLAIKNNTAFSVSNYEILRPAPSYTLDTVAYFQTLYQDIPLYLLIGADGMAKFGKWYRVRDLMNICTVCIMYRAGFDKPSLQSLRPILLDHQIESLSKHVIPTPLMDISSSAIRQKIKNNIEINDVLHSDVYKYIQQNGIYSLNIEDHSP